MAFRRSCFVVAAAVLWGPFLCGAAADHTPRHPSGRVPDITICTKDPDPEYIVEDADGRVFPSNHMMLMLEAGETRARADQIAGIFGGTVVGEISIARTFQLEVPITTAPELVTAMNQVRQMSGVAAVTRNLLFPLANGRAECPPHSDSNENLTEKNHRHPLQDITFFQTLTIFENLKDHISFHPVKVAVLDSGIAAGPNTLFDGMVAAGRLSNVMGRFPLRDALSDIILPEGLHYHGTRVASVIAAPEDFSETSGIASRILDDKLYLTGGTVTLKDWEAAGVSPGYVVLSKLLEGIGLAVAVERASIVNLSLCCQLDPDDAADRDQLQEFQFLLDELRDEVLFVVAGDSDADETPPEHLGDNSFPCGIDAPNLITVTGSSLGAPFDVEHMYSTGDARFVQIAAPGMGVPVEDPFRFTNFRHGTSYATPMVTAVAAILKSLGPSLSAPALKNRLTDISHWPELTAQDWEGNHPVRLHMYAVLGQYLLENSPSAEVRNMLRIPEFPQLQQYLGYVLARFCGYVNVEVEGAGGFTASFDEIWGTGAWPGVLDAESLVTFGGIGPPNGFMVALEARAPFRLDTALPLWAAAFSSGPGDCDPTGSSFMNGEMTIHECYIDQMDDEEGAWPKMVTLVGEYTTTLTWFEDICNEPTNFSSRQMSGDFDLPVVNMYQNDHDGVVYDLCTLGRPVLE